MTVAERMTAEEYFAGPERQNCQLIDGELVVNQPTWRHQSAMLEIVVALRAWARAAPDRGAAIVCIDVLIDEHNVFAPDAVWYADGRVPSPDLKGSPIPDLAVEVRSPSTWRYDVGIKKARYEREGVRELWLVDAGARSVLVFRRSRPGAPSFDVALELGAGEVLESPLLPAFACAVDAILAL